MNKKLRNFGFGKQLEYAARAAIIDRFGDKCHGTQAAYRNRIKHLLQYLRKEGVRDFREVDLQVLSHFSDFTRSLLDSGDLKKSTAVNVISTAVVLVRHMSGDSSLVLQPSQFIGRRTRLRIKPPLSSNKMLVINAAKKLRTANKEPVGQVALLCRNFGLRVKEASLLELAPAIVQAERRQQIDIRRGTKNGRGRTVERWVNCDSTGLALLKRCTDSVSATGCLIPTKMSWVQWYQWCYRAWRPIAPTVGLSTEFRDLRASWACDRYRELVGVLAPVFTGRVIAGSEIDQQARETISREMGHGRIDVVSSYIGGRAR